MFLFALTKNEISQNLKNIHLREFKTDSFYIMVAHDNFLAQLIDENEGFSIIESPLEIKDNSHSIIFSKIIINKNKKIINIWKNTISGRPIYYHFNHKGEFFCSTHINLLRKVNVNIQENLDALPEFFVHRIVMAPRTLYKDIYQLSIGDNLILKYDGGKCDIKSITHFSPPKINHNINSIEESSKEIHENLVHTLKNFELYKNQISNLLSGGIDSSILFKLSKDIFEINDSYSTGYPFEEPMLNVEKEYAISASNAFNSNHLFYEMTTNQYLEGFIEAIHLSENPLHHLQSICLHLLYKDKIPQNKSIIIEGWGAGGSFGNFRNYLFYKDKLLFKIITKSYFHKLLRYIPKITAKRDILIEMIDKSRNNLNLSDPNHPLWSYHDYGSKKWVINYLNTSEKEIIRNQYQTIKRFENESIYEITALYSLLGDEDITLSILSKLGEGNKKILLFPFYDNSLLKYVFSIPWKLKLGRPENVLRKSIARRCGVPNYIIDRPKSGFGIRSNSWFQRDGPFEPLIPLASKVIDEKEIRKLQSKDEKHAMTFWNILNYAIWKRIFIKNEPYKALIEELEI